MSDATPPPVSTPDWVKDAIFYQIFPDRFAKSEQVEKPSNLQPWGAPPTPEKYQGGDLLGVVEHLDHLVELGVTALYFTPVFQSASNHRYHTHDYYQVDPLLGGNTALRELVTAAHGRGLRVVLDGVFNHASRGFFQFNDILEHGPHSPWIDWFTVEGWPLAPYDGSRPANYLGWAGNRALPKFNTDNPQAREFLMRVGEYWLRDYGIDGWRLDVPDEITTPGFWEEFRRRVKAVNPEAYIVAEIWERAPQWLDGTTFDATMNYPFAAATIAFCAGERVSRPLVKDRSYDPWPAIDAPTFGQRLQSLLNLYPWEISLVQLNVLDSHDTARLLSIARGDKATVRLATLMQMCFPGPPSIYYGDEIGLRGTEAYDQPHEDPDARWPFPWQDRSQWDEALLAFFKAAIALRRAQPALRRGRFTQLFAKGQGYAFARGEGAEALIILLNAAEQPQAFRFPVGSFFAEGATLRPLFGEAQVEAVADHHLSVRVAARTGVVLGA